MKVTTEIREDHQALLTLELDASDLERAKRRVARELSRQYKIPGFRPGKAPYEVVVLHLGEGPILDKAIDQLLETHYPKALEDADLEPYAPGKVESLELEPNPVFKILVPLEPEVDLGDYRSIRVPYEPPEVQDEEVERALEELRERQAIIEPVDRPAEEGDLVYITLEGQGTRTNDEGEAEEVNFPQRQAPIVILSKAEEDEWPFPGFSRELIGLSKGDTKEVTYTYPEDAELEDLRGAQMTFKVQVDEVKSRTLPDVDDAFAQSLGDFETVDDLRQALRENIAASKREEYDAEYRDKVMEAVLAQATFKYPPQLVEETLDEMLASMRDNIASLGMSWQRYLEMSDTTEEKLREEMREEADRIARWRLVLQEIAKREDITAEQDEVMQELNARLFNMGMTMEQKRFRRILRDQEFLTRLYIASFNDTLLRRAEAFLLRVARGEAEAEQEEPAEAEEASAEATEAEEEASAEATEAAAEPEAAASSESTTETADDEAA